MDLTEFEEKKKRDNKNLHSFREYVQNHSETHLISSVIASDFQTISFSPEEKLL